MINILTNYITYHILTIKGIHHVNFLESSTSILRNYCVISLVEEKELFVSIS